MNFSCLNPSRGPVLKESIQSGSLPWAQSFRTGGPCGDPVRSLWGHKPWHQTCSSLGSSFHGSTAPARPLLQAGLPPGSQPPSGIPLLQGAPPGAAGGSLLPGTLPGLQGHGCPTMGCPRAAGEAQPRGLEPLLPLLLHCPGLCRAVPLPCSHCSLLTAQFHLCHSFIFPSPVCSPGGVTAISAGFSLGPSWTRLALPCWAWGKLPAAAHRTHPAAPGTLCSVGVCRTLL